MAYLKPSVSLSVIDSSSLIYLHHLNLLSKLIIRYDKVYVPRYVYEEVSRKRRMRHRLRRLFQEIPFLEQCFVTNEVNVQLLCNRKLNPSAVIDRGEAEVIIQARERQISDVLLDEYKGRKVAEQHTLNVVGTLGLLKMFKLNGIIPAVKPLIEKLQRDLDYRIDAKLLNVFLQEVGEL